MEIKQNSRVGKYAVAALSFQPGQEIFCETSFACGPKSGSPPVCLGCHKLLVNLENTCSKCRWPVCDERCEKIETHREAECRVFSKSHARFYKEQARADAPCMQYECIVPLRVLLAKLHQPERWSAEVEPMESHDKLRKDLPVWLSDSINVVGYLRGPCKLAALFDQELIHRVCGILEVNAFEIPSIETGGVALRGLFPKLALLSHNCVSNISHTIILKRELADKMDFEVIVRASKCIEKSQELFSSYTHSILPTTVRRNNLRQSKYFECTCERCSDSIELGSHTSTLLCQQCSHGFLTSISPLDPQSDWICNKCGHLKLFSDVKDLHHKIQNDLCQFNNRSSKSDLKSLQKFLSHYHNVLHPQHSYNCHVYLLLLDSYNKKELLSKSEHLKKLRYCDILLRVLDIIEPGLTRLRGRILYEYAIAELDNLESERPVGEDVTKIHWRDKKLRTIMSQLEEAIAALKFENLASEEGKTRIKAEGHIFRIRDKFDSIVNATTNC